MPPFETPRHEVDGILMETGMARRGSLVAPLEDTPTGKAWPQVSARAASTMYARTYKMAPDPPLAVSWSDYKDIAESEFAKALEAEAAEAEFHALFERHPCLLPGRRGMRLNGAEGAFPAAVISKPRLPSWGGKIPDFMWITSDSVTLAPVLIEIEAPGKPWFTKAGQQTHKLTQALSQLLDWRLWFEDSYHREAFLDFYHLDGMLRQRLFRPEFILIYGRRADAHKTEAHARKRGLLQTDTQAVVSYDRLFPSEAGSEYMCVAIDANGYKALAVPPTITLSPLWAKERALVAGKVEAVQANVYIPELRKAFLKDRMPYWDEWAQLDNKGTLNLGDRE